MGIWVGCPWELCLVFGVHSLFGLGICKWVPLFVQLIGFYPIKWFYYLATLAISTLQPTRFEHCRHFERSQRLLYERSRVVWREKRPTLLVQERPCKLSRSTLLPQWHVCATQMLADVRRKPTEIRSCWSSSFRPKFLQGTTFSHWDPKLPWWGWPGIRPKI